MPETVSAKGLLGWMSEDEALMFLRNCVFDKPQSDAEMRALWQQYRDKVVKLGNRTVPTFNTHKLSLAEESTGKTVVNKGRKAGGANLRRVIKVDPRSLLIHQLWITVDQSERYADAPTPKPREPSRSAWGMGPTTSTASGETK